MMINTACSMPSSTWFPDNHFALSFATLYAIFHPTSQRFVEGDQRSISQSLLCFVNTKVPRHTAEADFGPGKRRLSQSNDPEHPFQHRRDHHRRKSGNCDYLVRSSPVTSDLPDAPREIPEVARLVVCHDENLSIDSHIWSRELCHCSLLV